MKNLKTILYLLLFMTILFSCSQNKNEESGKNVNLKPIYRTDAELVSQIKADKNYQKLLAITYVLTDTLTKLDVSYSEIFSMESSQMAEILGLTSVEYSQLKDSVHLYAQNLINIYELPSFPECPCLTQNQEAIDKFVDNMQGFKDNPGYLDDYLGSEGLNFATMACKNYPYGSGGTGGGTTYCGGGGGGGWGPDGPNCCGYFYICMAGCALIIETGPIAVICTWGCACSFCEVHPPGC